MANIIKQATRKNRIKRLSKDKLEKELEEVKVKNKKASDELTKIEKDKNDLLDNHANRTKKLSKSHKNDLSKIEEEKKRLETELADFDSSKAKADKRSAKQKEAIDKKENEIKEKHKRVIKKEIDNSKKKHETEKAKYVDKLEKVDKAIKTQGDKYNNSIKKVEDSAAKKEAVLKKEKHKLEKKIADVEKINEKEISTLEENKKELLEENKNELEALEEEQKKEEARIVEDEESILNQKRAELNSQYLKLEELDAKKNSFIKNLDSTRERLEREYLDLADEYDQERKLLNESNEALRRDLEFRKEKDIADRELAKVQYKEKVAKLDDLIALYGDKEESAFKNLEKALAEKDDEYKEKYSDFVDYLDKQYKQEQQIQAKEIEDLKYRIAQEQEQLKSRNAYLKERLDNREAECKRVNEALTVENQELEAKVIEIEDKCATRINDLKAELAKIKAEHATEIEAKERSLISRVHDIKANNEIIRKELVDKKKAVGEEITKINDEIVKIKNDLNIAISDANAKKERLQARHNEEVNNIKKETDAINQEFAKFEEEVAIKNSKEKQEDLLGQLEFKKGKALNEHNLKLVEMNEEHAKSLDKLKADYDIKVSKAQSEHDEIIKNLKNKFQELKQAIINEDIGKKAEYEETKNILNLQANNLSEDSQISIDKLHAQKSTLLSQIRTIKETLLSEQELFDKTREELEKDREEKIHSLEEEYQQKIDEMKTFADAPTSELEKIQASHNLKVIEHENAIKMINDEKDKLEREINELITKHKDEKAEAEACLNMTKSLYEKSKAEADHEYQALQEELATKEKELEDYNKALSLEVEELKTNHQKELEDLVAKQESQYKEIEDAYKEKQESISRLYEQEIKAKQDELDAKKTDYANSIDDIKRRKAKIEYDCTSAYNVELDRTKAIKEELKKVSDENESKRIEWNTQLETRKNEIETELSNLRDSYSKSIGEKKKILEKKLQELKAQSYSLRNDIRKLEEDADAKQKNLESYRLKKTSEFEKLKTKVNERLNDINKSLKNISLKEEEYKDIHQKRVVEIKHQIAKTMSEYEEMNKIKPFALKKENEDSENELMAKANEFKEMIKELEKSHKDILTVMDNSRQKALSDMETQLSELVSGSSELKEDYEKGLADVTEAFSALIAKEKSKQDKLREEINQNNLNADLVHTSYDEKINDNDFRLTQEKDLLEKKFAEDVALVEKEEEEKLGAANSGIKQLETKKNDVLEEIEKLDIICEKIDEDIANKRLSLENVMKEKIKEIDAFYHKQVVQSKTQYKPIDKMNDQVSDVFKKSN